MTDSKPAITRGQKAGKPSTVARLTLEALARYVESGLAKPTEDMYKTLATRAAKTAVEGEWPKS